VRLSFNLFNEKTKRNQNQRKKGLLEVTTDKADSTTKGEKEGVNLCSELEED
jgi:hypothetical protein